MSIEATTWAWGQKIRPAQKLVLLALADRAGSGCQSWPSIERIKGDTSLDIKTVRACLNELCSLGLLSRSEEIGKGYIYTLDLNRTITDTPTKNGTTPEIGTPTKNGSGPLPKTDEGGTKNGSGPLPKTVPESLREPSKNLKENHNTRTRVDTPKDFLDFWSAYPKKVGKKAALKAWKNAKDKPLLDAIIASLERQRASPQWLKDGGEYIPNPATWLNQGRWDDECCILVQPVVKTLDDLMAERGLTQ